LRWLGVAAAALTLVVPVTAGPAAADPIASKKAQADALAKQLEAKGERVSQLAEQLNAAQLQAAQLDVQLQQAEAGLAAADARSAAVQQLLRTQAIDVYIRGAQRTVQTPTSHLDVAVQHLYVSSIASTQRDVLDQVRASKIALDEQKSQYLTAKKASEAALAQVTASQRAAARAEADVQAQLSKVKGQLATLVAQAEAKRAAAEAARVQAELASRSAVPARASRSQTSASDVVLASAPAPPVKPGAQGAIEEAQRQLGKPYRYGGSGPGSFDCSGLTSWAWGKAGRGLPHSSVAQYHALPHVSLSAIQPGDLVFFGSDLHHVGLYVGGGQMIEAPRTGIPVRYASIYRSDLVGAARP
jgi:cell wall-associated NlpC family hydrolase